MAVIRNVQKVAGLITSGCAMFSSSTILTVCVLLYIITDSTTNAQGAFCSLFGAECRSGCIKSSIVQVQYDLCSKPLVCCFKSQKQTDDRGLPTPDLSGGEIPYRRNRYQPRKYPQPYLPKTTTHFPLSTSGLTTYANPPPSVCGIRGRSRVKRLINGVDTQRCRYPWMVLLDRGRNSWDTCGASLISDRHIITAAHCFGNIPGRPVVVVGEFDKNEIRPGSEIRITDYKVTMHPDYDIVKFVNDIAIITLTTPLDLSKYECLRPVCLPDEGESLPVGTNCIVIGWGSVQRYNAIGMIPRTSNILQETTIQVVRSAQCQKAWSTNYHRDIQICAGDMSGRTDSCLGDSGGPLMCPTYKNRDVYYLHGVVSFGSRTCATPNVPALYTKVGKYRPWINVMMKP